MIKIAKGTIIPVAIAIIPKNTPIHSPRFELLSIP